MSALRRIADDPRWGALIVLLIAAAVYLPRLGADGLAGTEGHRVIPGWELLDRLGTPTVPGGSDGGPAPAGQADLDVQDLSSLVAPTMFDRLYLRKPPGMMWAEAASAAAFGRSEWSARFVGAASSIAMALAAFFFACRWFGARAGLASGVALALTPWLWQSGRSAEIEPLHNLMVALAAFCAIDLLLGTPTVPGGRSWLASRREGNGARRARVATAFVAAGLAVAVAGAAAAKGPAGAPVLGGAVAGGLLVAWRTPGIGRRLALLILSLAAGGAAIIAVWVAMRAAAAAPGTEAVSQSAGEFLWSGPILEILTLPLVALIAALPLTLALPQAWARGTPTPQRGNRDAGSAASGGSPPGQALARALGWATLIAIAIYTLIGLSNVRYVMPVAPLMAPLVGWAVANGAVAPRRSLAGVFDRLITRRGLLWIGALLVGSQVYIWGVEPSRDGRSGRDTGRALASALPPGAELWANDLIEAVPETLLYAQLAAGDGLRVRWRDVRPGEAPAGVYLALRSDGDSSEADAWRARAALPAPIFEGAVRHYRFIVIEAP